MRIQIEPGQRLHKFKTKLQYEKKVKNNDNNNNISTLQQQHTNEQRQYCSCW